ncbi:hypothetical protein EVG20_g7375 [Dentipellis fragilis]|uniref:Fungal-type protein kinase domain-containing protein n=1 Tax=Dentipellis fragilis TaxID=205917 RepID=A0A4Y9YHZ4_9AGAM|nr:hypothetical protein EVG20_g7375 [Dentipellis fragilis]
MLFSGEDHRQTSTSSVLVSQPWHSLVNSRDRPISTGVDVFVKHLLNYQVSEFNTAALRYQYPERLKEAYLYPKTPADRLAPLARIIDDVHIRARKIVRAVVRDRAAKGTNAGFKERLCWTDIVDSDDIFVVDKRHVKLMEPTPKPSIPSTRAPRCNHEQKRKSDDADTGIHKRQKNTDGLPIHVLVPGIHSKDTPKPKEKAVAETHNTEVGDSAKGMALMLRVAQERLTSAAGRRRYVLALLTDGSMIQLVCFDRTTITMTYPFDMFRQPALFAFIVVALFASNRVHFGYEPLISLPAPLTPHGMLTRLSSYLASRSTSNPLSSSRASCSPVHRFPAPAHTHDISSTPSPLIAKMGWPLQKQKAEDSIIRGIRNKVGPHWAAYLPRIECSQGITSQWQLGILPRLLTAGSELSRNQVFRVLVCECLEHLWTVRSLDEFKSVFVDIVRFHRVAYLKAGILHGDLSFANLMLRRDASERVTGVLNDWDLAIRMNSKNKLLPGGTMPFIATELLQRDPPRQRYRHDLESFVWILVWSMYQIDFTGADLPQCDELTERLDVDSDVLPRARVLFMEADVHSWKFQPHFKPLVEKWLKPLFDMLLQAVEIHAENNWEEIDDEIFNNETLGGYMTYDRFMKAIGEDPYL